MSKLGVIGAGNMATAILSGAIKSQFISPEEILAYDISEEKREQLKEKGIGVSNSVELIATECKYILLSVKPQVVPKVLYDISKLVSSDTVIISIAAGINAKTINSHLGKSVKTVLVMPNTPIMVGCGTAAICRNDMVTDDELKFATDLFACSGIVENIPVDKMNEVIAVHGSTPAYIYLITKYFCEYASEHGISYDVANKMFCQTLIGSAKMMTETGLSHQELIDMVSSPNGTTVKGLETLQSWAIQGAVFDCCEQTIKRAYELGNATSTD